MHDLSRQRCFNHTDREAAALCTHCNRFFCRECVTEHDDRVICAACLRPFAAATHPHRHPLQAAALALRGLAALTLLWLVFYALGHALLRLPTAFHEGALWNEAAPDLGMD